MKLCPKPSSQHAPTHWTPVENFKISSHLQIHRSAEPLEYSKALEIVASILVQEFNQELSPWHFSIVQQTQDSALFLFCLHHSLGDGVGGMEFVYDLFDEGPPKGLPKAAAKVNQLNPLLIISQLLSEWFYSNPCGKAGTRNDASISETSPALRPNSESRLRTIATCSWSSAQIKRLKRTYACSANDILLAASCYSFLTHFSKTQIKNSPLMRVIIPVNYRPDQARYDLGNRLGGASVMVRLADSSTMINVTELLSAVKTQMTKVKSGGLFETYSRLAALLEFIPYGMRKFISHTQAKRSNFICTNLTAPSTVRHIAETEVEGLYPLAAPMPGQPLTTGFTSYSGQFNAVVVADRNQGISGARFVASMQEFIARLDEQNG